MRKNFRWQSECVSVDALQLVDSHVNFFQIGLFEKSVGYDRLDEVVVEKKRFYGVWDVLQSILYNFFKCR